MDLVRLAHYPFLPEVRDVVREEGPSIPELLSSPLYARSRERALERVRASLGSGIPPPQVTSEREALLELMSVPVARMLVVDIAEKPLSARYAAAEAKLVAQVLARDADKALHDAVRAVGIVAERDESWRLHISEYLKRAPAEPAWKLIRRAVSAGHVRLDDAEMVRLVQETLQRRIVQELEAQRVPHEWQAALEPLVGDLEPALEEARASWTSGDFGPVQPGLFPPCVKAIFGELSQGRNVPHHARFAFATFLNTIGWNAEQIMDYLASTPNFDREKSRYQIEHITGQKGVEAYMVPNCSTMQTNGVCPLQDRDGVCFRIKNPLGYYRVRLRLQRREEAAKVPSEGEATKAPSQRADAAEPGAVADARPPRESRGSVKPDPRKPLGED